MMETASTPWMSLGGGAADGKPWPGLWREALPAGKVSGPLAVLALTGQMPAVDVPVSPPMMIAGAVVVGAMVTGIILSRLAQATIRTRAGAAP